MEPIINPISTPGLSQSGVPAQTPAQVSEGVSFADLVAKAGGINESKGVPSETDMFSAAQSLEQLLAGSNLKLHFASTAAGKPSIEIVNSETGAVVGQPKPGEVLAALESQSIDGLVTG